MNDKIMPKYKCVICKGDFTDWGNNPSPVKKKGRCCSYCNSMIVIPARIAFHLKLSTN